MIIRRSAPADFDRWLPLWEGYNLFYKRAGPTAISDEVTRTTWARFHDPTEPMFALVAEEGGRLAGFAHFLFHRSTSMLNSNCYLQDLFTEENLRGRGVGRALIEAVAAEARTAGSPRIYWQTHETNEVAMKLYEKIAKRSGFLVYVKPTGG